jgi:hypothetical protein
MTFSDARAGVNLNTYITLAGFALTIGAGVMVYGAERAENALRHDQANKAITALIAQKAETEARIRALELGAGRTEEKLINILAMLDRISRQLEVKP